MLQQSSLFSSDLLIHLLCKIYHAFCMYFHELLESYLYIKIMYNYKLNFFYSSLGQKGYCRPLHPPPHAIFLLMFQHCPRD